MEKQLKRLIREKYPFPIAHTHKKALGALDDDMYKLHCILVTAEKTIQFLALLAHSQVHHDLVNNQFPNGNIRKGIIEKIQTSSPGNWNDIAKELIKNYRDCKEQLIVPELFDFYFIENSKKKKIPVNSLQNKIIGPLIKLRNDFHHNRISESRLVENVRYGDELMQQLLEAVSFLSRYQLSYIQKITVDTDENQKTQFTHDLVQVSGCFSTFGKNRWKSDINLKSGQVVFINSDTGNHLVLNPFVTFTSQIPGIGVSDVFLLDRIPKTNKVIYTSSQFVCELNTRQEEWVEGIQQQTLLADFYNRLRLLEPSSVLIEIEDNGDTLPEDDTSFSTTEVFHGRYAPTEQTSLSSNPYMFLNYYEPTDRNIFFGRDKEIQVLLKKFYNSRLLVLQGESGTGKTSLIRAGLIPQLSSGSYVTVYVRVKKEPAIEIKKELIRQLDRDNRYLELPLDSFLEKETEFLNKTIVVVMDQFEEFFLRFDKKARMDFINEFEACIEKSYFDIKFIISLRSDYFFKLAEFETAIPTIFTHQFQLHHFSEKQAVEAIIRPPEQFNISINEEMVTSRMVPDLRSVHGVELPLLQIVCDALYQNALENGNTEINNKDYDAVGDVKGVLSNYLEKKLGPFGDHATEAKKVFKALITPEGLNRASYIDEIILKLNSEGYDIQEGELKNNYLDKFISYRLVRVEEFEGKQRFELIHDYFAKHIHTMVEREKKDLEIVKNIIFSAYNTYRSTKSKLLLETSALKVIEPFEEQLELKGKVKTFFEASKRNSKKKKQGILLKVGMLLIAVSILFGGGFGYKAYQSYQEAIHQEKKAAISLKEANHNLGIVFKEKAERALGDKKYNTARLYAYHALANIDPSRGEAERLTTTGIVLNNPEYPVIYSSPFNAQHFDNVNAVKFSPDGKTLASGSNDRTIRLWDVETGRTKYILNTPSFVTSVSFSPDGKTLASGSVDHTVRFWNVETGKEKSIITGYNSTYCNTVSFSPNGKFIVYNRRLWNVKTGKQMFVMPNSGVIGNLSFTLDSKILAYTCLRLTNPNNKTIYLWDVETGRGIFNLNGHTMSVKSVSFSPDGKTLASASWDKTIRLWNVETGKEKSILTEHTDGVNSVSFSPDGKTLASGSWDKTIRLWSVETGKEMSILKGHTDRVDIVSFSPDGKTLASGSSNGTIRLWDLTKGIEKTFLPGHKKNIFIAGFSTDGKTLVSVESHTIRLWDVETGREKIVLAGHTSIVTCVNFSPDGKTLASGSWDKTIRLWNVETGREKSALMGHTDRVKSVRFSPDGKTLATASRDRTIRLWNVETGREALVLTVGSVDSMSFSSDGKALASSVSYEKYIRLWNVKTGKDVSILTGNTDRTSFSPDGKTFATSHRDNSIRLWNIDTGGEVLSLTGHTSAVNRMVFSSDGKTLATSYSDNTIQLWDVETGRKIPTLSGHTSYIKSIVFSPNGKSLASWSHDKTIRLWDVETGKLEVTLNGYSEARNVCFSPDGKILVAGLADKSIRFWDIETGKKKSIIDENINIDSRVMLSPNCQILAFGERDNTIRLWDVETGREISVLTGHEGHVNSVIFSSDGRTLASGSKDKTIRLWDVETGKVKHILSGHTGRIESVDFLPDNKTLASGSHNKTIRLWDIETGKEKSVLNKSNKKYSGSFTKINFLPNSNGKSIIIAAWYRKILLLDAETGREISVLSGHSDDVMSFSFSSDAKILASGSEDKTIRLWDVETGREKYILNTPGSVTSVSFLPDGKTLASGSGDKTIRLWDVETGREIGQISGVNNMNFSSDGSVLTYDSYGKNIKSLDELLFYSINDKHKLQEQINEARQKYNLKLANMELRPIIPERNLYGNKSNSPQWPKTHPFHWLKKAKNGDADAMIELGIIYDRDSHYKSAKFWYKKAIEAGNEDGEYRLKLLEKWQIKEYILTKAKNGNANAMHSLGVIYNKDSDSKNAEFWYKKAIEAGFVSGKYRLRLLYKWLAKDYELTKDYTDVRIRPHYRNGESDGYIINGIKGGAVSKKVGFQNSDIIRRVDGKKIESVDEAMALFSGVKNMNNMSVEIKRRGRVQTLDFNKK